MSEKSVQPSLPIGIFKVSSLALAGALLLANCTKTNSGFDQLVVANITTSEVATAPASAFKLADQKATDALKAGEGPVNLTIATPSSNPVVVATVTLNKKSLLNRIFLYGSDLQYSSISDGGMSLILQSLAIGHVPAYFRIVDSKLQMLQDQKHMFESDVNHPERLLHEFDIVAQDASTVMIKIANASPVLNTVAQGAKAAPVRTSWIRSVEFVPQGEYLMFETSIELADGSVAEFMESLFPRDLVISASEKPILADAELEPLAERYGLLDSGDIFLEVASKGRVKTKVASRFASTPGTTIDWYVTPNIPDIYVSQIKTSIEGWNRYSQKMWGKDMVAFKGSLPSGVKIGDPRYNVVNWDSISEAGAAYESQATDPYTGVTTHSLIYLPKAWINIGKKYWDNGGPSEAQTAGIEKVRRGLNRASYLGQKLPVRCIEDSMEKMSLESRVDSEAFSKELLKGVLFHEVGHALGLAHNFKGSLSFDPDDAKSPITTSIMDYNQYQLEKAVFDKLDSANGPLLEYDRQIISVLYNGGKDVSATDAKVPACDDSMADDEDGGMDPLCIRYDSGHDPSLQLIRTIDLVRKESTTIRDTRSLPASIASLVKDLPAADSIKDKAEAVKVIKSITKTIAGVTSFYYIAGAQSLANMARSNIRMLKLWKDSTLPDGAKEYVEREMRGRAIEGIRYAATAEVLEPDVSKAIENLTAAIKAWTASTAYISGIEAEKKVAEIDALVAPLDGFSNTLGKNVLSKLRTRIYAEMKASEKSPFYFIEKGAQSFDFERDVAQILSRAVVEKLTDGDARPAAERTSAAKSLKTFATSAVGSGFVADAAKSLQTEARTARDMEARANALTVYKALIQDDKGK